MQKFRNISSRSILYIGKNYQNKNLGGREMLANLNYQILSYLFQNNFFEFDLKDLHSSHNKPKLFRKIFFGEIDGINAYALQKIFLQINEKNISYIFIDGSNLGALAKFIKKKFKHIHVITFFHNVETKFFFDSFLKNKSLRSVGILIANFFSERKATKFSDSIICLTSVDAFMLKKFFSRENNNIMPLCIEDNFSPIEGSIKNDLNQYVLFVGGYFYANEQGIRWFIENVSPYIYADTYVVGRGFEKMKTTFIDYKNVKIIGEVEDLSYWYINSDCVVAPIFSGSGMKTKVAEALMYGKKVFATNQALTGYDLGSNSAFTECNNASDFIKAINNHGKLPKKKFYKESRQIFLENYSSESAISRLSNIFNLIEKNFKN